MLRFRCVWAFKGRSASDSRNQELPGDRRLGDVSGFSRRRGASWVGPHGKSQGLR